MPRWGTNKEFREWNGFRAWLHYRLNGASQRNGWSRRTQWFGFLLRKRTERYIRLNIGYAPCNDPEY